MIKQLLKPPGIADNTTEVKKSVFIKRIQHFVNEHFRGPELFKLLNSAYPFIVNSNGIP